MAVNFHFLRVGRTAEDSVAMRDAAVVQLRRLAKHLEDGRSRPKNYFRDIVAKDDVSVVMFSWIGDNKKTFTMLCLVEKPTNEDGFDAD